MNSNSELLQSVLPYFYSVSPASDPEALSSLQHTIELIKTTPPTESEALVFLHAFGLALYEALGSGRITWQSIKENSDPDPGMAPLLNAVIKRIHKTPPPLELVRQEPLTFRKSSEGYFFGNQYLSVQLSKVEYYFLQRMALVGVGKPVKLDEIENWLHIYNRNQLDEAQKITYVDLTVIFGQLHAALATVPIELLAEKKRYQLDLGEMTVTLPFTLLKELQEKEAIPRRKKKPEGTLQTEYAVYLLGEKNILTLQQYTFLEAVFTAQRTTTDPEGWVSVTEVAAAYLNRVGQLAMTREQKNAFFKQIYRSIVDNKGTRNETVAATVIEGKFSEPEYAFRIPLVFSFYEVPGGTNLKGKKQERVLRENEF